LVSLAELKMSITKKFKGLASGVIIYALLVFPLFGQDNSEVKTPSVIPKENWKNYSSVEGHFSICLPGSPEQTNIVVNTKVGDVRIFRVCVWPDDETEYSINCTDYRNSPTNLTPQQRFDAARATLKAHSSWQLEYEKDITLGNCPGKEFGFAVGGKSKVSGRVRIFCGNNCLYQTQVIFHRDNPHPEDFKKFLDSFSIDDKADNKNR